MVSEARLISRSVPRLDPSISPIPALRWDALGLHTHTSLLSPAPERFPH